MTEFSGYFYQGYYLYDILLAGTGSSNITKAEFLMSLSLNSSDTLHQETQVNEKLRQWANEGYSVILKSNSKISQYTQDLGKVASTLCDPELSCITSIYCTDTTSETCTENPIVQTCKSGVGCNNVEVKCTSVEILCIKANNSCTSDCACISTVEVCKKWTSECLEESDQCKDKVIDKDNNSCLKKINTCVKQEDIEPHCKLSCEWNLEVYNLAYKKYLMYQDAYNKTQKDLIGFEELKVLLKNNEEPYYVKIKDICAQRYLNESGIGPYELVFKVDSVVISVKSYHFMDYDLMMIWDFYDDLTNQQTLMVKSKQAIVELSEGLLTQDLVYKSAEEVAAENIDYSNGY